MLILDFGLLILDLGFGRCRLVVRRLERYVMKRKTITTLFSKEKLITYNG
jgi:hypothetical protein